jgi:uncharacterized protein YukE
MYSPCEIQYAAGRIQDEKYDLNNNENSYYAQAKDGSDWWQGTAYSSFIEGYTQIQQEVKRLYNKIDDLDTSMGYLATDVQRAEDERRIREEIERRRLEEAARAATIKKK